MATVPAGGGGPGAGPEAPLLAQTPTAVKATAPVRIAARISFGRVKERWRRDFAIGEGSGSGSDRP
ncbi:hypothetical protein OHB01_12450 [Microbispora hainanensis]|uniref:Uncharacterized protein n=1 Tax=Microbispora hainanensis TaxID=568844 RepID=A0ABZ1SK47_9ACTN|nr:MULTISPECIES: hypothetical protein [Microbispora]NJP26641.1 hypothetical protein [Microbispora sp. CL1-1]TQS12144.1 hypothetical protein FLW53_21105 [Microbispora sp. SCL1-1]